MLPQTHAILAPLAADGIKVQDKMWPCFAQAIDPRILEAKHLRTQQGLNSCFETGSPPKKAPKLPTLITCLEWQMPGGGGYAQQGNFMLL